MTEARGVPSLPSLMGFILGASVLVAGCGSARPSTAPLSASAPRSTERARPSFARAVEPGSDDHPSVESEGPSPGDDDDDDDSTGTTGNRQDTRDLLTR